ncbi:MAG: NAD-dependent epimerase/dehydratase family protein [Elusimicrobiota bacterium]|jgi:GDP-L-fucose synthase
MSFWDGRRVLVTGGAGFIGSHLVELLLAAGKADVTVADDLSNGALENLAVVEGRYRFERVDLRDPAAAARVARGHDVVLHLAAKVGGVGYNVRHPALMFRDNLRMNSAVLEAAVAAGAERVLMTSSACVYPRHCTVPTPESEGFRDWPEDTNEGYGWAKRMAEFEALACHKEFGLRVALARPYNTYGPRDHFDPEVSHVVPALVRRVLSGEDPVRVWGDGAQTRAFLYVTDTARGMLMAAERYAECDALNLGTDEEVPIRDLVALVLELCGSKARVEFDPSKPAGQPRRNCDVRKAHEKAGFAASVTLREGLGRTIDWYRRREGK